MEEITNPLIEPSTVRSASAVLVMVVAFATSAGVSADEVYAKTLLKSMSDYVSAQKNISFKYDTILEVVTNDQQRLALAGSGTVVMSRPDKLRSTRASGFADVEMLFDGKTLTLLGKGKNIYAQTEVTGTLDHLLEELRVKYHRPLPGADLFISNPEEQLMSGVNDVKDLGSGVIGGVECDHLAFRKDNVDWQIWIAQGDQPYPCRYSITSKQIAGGPQYSIQFSEWKSGDTTAPNDFAFNNATNAKKIELKDLPNAEDLPDNFEQGKTK